MSAPDLQLEWGEQGLNALAGVRSLVIVDLLSFSTCVDIAVARGACVLPFPHKDARAAA